ncbi:glutamate-rich WD repeat-containing protein 1-like [Macrosteles quadrilineatus]|uniref:glutamate-rich WD repeat-containing protein 1-like n=1 Tax=Macrosteles quadrilineatus TaxID=74068 RepID=UPI0023E31222|nr:glutamate-rich WD repeat-containing protein 1-like [Macrosteles quadrilineatus]
MDIENEEVNDEEMKEDVQNNENDDNSKVEKIPRKVYLPGQPLAPDEELVCDPSAYIMLHEYNTGSPCLSFDIIKDCFGNKREDYPLTAHIVAGTQADRPNNNSVIVTKLSNMHKIQDEESDSDSDEDDEEDAALKPKMESILIKHHGSVNRIRVTQNGDVVLCGVWSEQGKVTLLDLKPQLVSLEDPIEAAARRKTGGRVGEPIRPLFVFTGHQSEGYGIAWCPTQPGVLATGDCRRNIHVWKPADNGASWSVDQRPLVGHSASVEDLCWSPNEPYVLASCSVDKTIRIWDTREAPTKACKLTVEAHTSDVNVISWNEKEPLIASGGDDGFLHIWDLRNFQTGSAVASLKHHSAPITTVEWQPCESSVLAAGGEDDQISLWDLAVERDDTDTDTEIKDLPPQLMFIHQGQTEVKELHWHPQQLGVIISTANSGFNVFRTISV